MLKLDVKKEKSNAKVAWRENLKVLSELQKTIEECIEDQRIPSPEVAEQYASILVHAQLQWQRYYRLSVIDAKS